MRDPKSRHDGYEEAPAEIDPEGSSGSFVHRRMILGSALRTLAIGGLAAGGIVGCASTTRMLRSLPDPDLPRGGTGSTGGSRRRLDVTPEVAAPAGVSGVLARNSWTADRSTYRPNYGRMDQQKSLRCITIHHDGLDQSRHPYGSSSRTAAQTRLKTIHSGHVGHNGWADIGYHFASDRGGRVWECRPIAYQGAHVRHHNEGNIGILVMGNFDVQRPTSAQIRALGAQVNALCLSFGIPKTFDRRRGVGVCTHKEWGAATACPGRNLQPKVDTLRARGFRT